MRKSVIIVGMILLAGCSAGAAPPEGKVAEKLQPEEYPTVALIYNDELEILGERAFYPICINAGDSTKALLRYLHHYRYPLYDSHICNPSLKHGDFPHGMNLEVLKLQHGPKGELDIETALADLTIHVGEHFATLLRQGTYHFKQNEEGEWEIAGYTKKFDYRDEKEGSCDSGSAAKSIQQ